MVESRPPEGARPIIEFFDEERAAPNDERLARLAWSLAVGTLRALVAIHERGIHHGDLSPEKALQSRIVARERPDGLLDVYLQFPAERLALRHQKGLPAEVPAAEQADVARLAHLLRSVIARRDPLDSDTRLDPARLEMLFGRGAKAWQEFFTNARAGPPHGDPSFIRSRLERLKGASPRERDFVTSLRILWFRAWSIGRRSWPAAAALLVLATLAWLVLDGAERTPAGWRVKLDEKPFDEGDDLVVTVDGEAKSLKARIEVDGENVGGLSFTQQGAGWWAKLPNRDKDYEVVFDDETRIFVVAKDDDTDFRVNSSSSDPDGMVTIEISASDPDSQPDLNGVQLKLAGMEPAKPPELLQEDNARRTATWKLSFDLAELQSDKSKEVSLVGNFGGTSPEFDIHRVALPELPFELALDVPASAKPGAKATVTWRSNTGTKPRKVEFTTPGGPSFKELSGESGEVKFDIEGSKSEYEACVRVGRHEIKKRVAGYDEPTSYVLSWKNDSQSDRNKHRVVVTVTATDRDDSEPTPPVLKNSENLKASSPLQPLRGKSGEWSATYDIDKLADARQITFSLGAETTSEISIDVPHLEKGAVKPVKLEVKLSALVTNKAIAAIGEDEEFTIRTEPPQTSGHWVLKSPTGRLANALQTALREINGRDDRSGRLKAPQFSEQFTIELSLEDNEGEELAARLQVVVNAKDSPTKYDVTVLTASEENVAAETEPVITSRVTVSVTAIDEDSAPDEPSFSVPALQLNGEPRSWVPAEVTADSNPKNSSGFSRTYRAEVVLPRGDSTLTVAGTRYSLRWQPSTPVEANAFLKEGFTKLTDDTWISKPIGLNDLGEFVFNEPKVMTNEDLTRLLQRYEDCGLEARLATVEEVQKLMMEPPSKPTKEQVLVSLIGERVFNSLKTRPKDLSLQWLREGAGVKDPTTLREPGTPDPVFRVTFCDSREGVVVVGLPSLPADPKKSKDNLRKAHARLLNQQSTWDPKPWRSEQGFEHYVPNKAFARIVLRPGSPREDSRDPAPSPTSSSQPSP